MSATFVYAYSGEDCQITKSPEVQAGEGPGSQWASQAPTGTRCRRKHEMNKKQNQGLSEPKGSLWGQLQIYTRDRLGWGSPIKAGHLPTECDKLKL